MAETKQVSVTPRQVAAFRLSRHHLARRAPARKMPEVVGDMVGAQAQVLSAAQMSIRARIDSATVEDMESAIWKGRKLVRAWAMRRTMFLLPSDELALYARGTHRRAAYGLRWAQKRISPARSLERLLEDVVGALDEPQTRSGIAKALESKGYKLHSKAGGGWGDSRAVNWVKVGNSSLPIGFLIHMIGAREVVCSGPTAGNESTYVRADRWIPSLKDMAVEEAEGKLLEKYLRAFGPATPGDFALWAGMYIRDAKEIWRHVENEVAQVKIEGKAAWVLRSDLPELEKEDVGEPVVRLLPFFDSFLLGHKSHRNIVDEGHHKMVYRAQGWVSPVLLIDGRARGVWSYKQVKDELEVSVTPFGRLPSAVIGKIRQVAAELGQYLGSESV